MRRRVVFLINLLQDVNIIRPLALLAARDTELQISFLVSDRFNTRDKRKIWMPELNRLAKLTHASVTIYDSPFSAFQSLQGGVGLIVAASESNLSAHAQTHDVLRAAPPAYLKVTLQHGFECVGFLHSQEHDRAHGDTVRFASDIVAGWSPAHKQRSMAASEKSKYYLSGPTALIPTDRSFSAIEPPPSAEALICENLHSVRFGADGGSRDAFMEAFEGFVLAMSASEKTIALRPHPGGKRAFGFDLNAHGVSLVDQPIYQLDLRRFEYGVSPPSSVLIDLVLAGVPAAVWRDPCGEMDAGNYAGLTTVGVVSDLLAFRKVCIEGRSGILERQAAFLRQSQILADAREVETRFLRLLNGGTPQIVSSLQSCSTRLLVVADSVGATQSISFRQPLEADPSIKLTLAANDVLSATESIDRLWTAADPTALVLSRYTEGHAGALVDRARQADIPVIFHIDDDLLAVPCSLGPAKYDHYTQPNRVASLRDAMNASDVVYASTMVLADRLRDHGITSPVVAGDIYCAKDAARCPAPQWADQPTIGYMATGGHGADLAQAAPAIAEVMTVIPELRFETFGKVELPQELRGFSARITQHPGMADYDGFLKRLGDLGWWAGIAPLEDTVFNRCKADTKWVEYTFSGTPVVAASLPVYAFACDDGAGILAKTQAEWRDGLIRLVTDSQFRFDTLTNARAKLSSHYGLSRLKHQVLAVIDQAAAIRRNTPRSMGEAETTK